MAWVASLGHTLRKGFHTERAVADPWAIARAVLAVAVGAVIGWSLDDILATTMMSVGSFICGIGTLLAPLRHRTVNALVMAVAFSAAATLGVYLQPTGWYFLIPLAFAAFLAGLWRALGAAPGIRACLVVIGMLITADVSPGVTGGLDMVKWIAAGAGLVVLVQLLPPYGRRHAAQRRMLSGVYRSLADYTRSLDGAAGPVRLSSAPFSLARTSLGLLPQFARPAAAPLYGLLGEAERIRRTLYSLPGASGTTRVPHSAVADILAAVAATVASGRVRHAPAEAWQQLHAWRGDAAGSLLPRVQEAARLAELSAASHHGSALEPHGEIPVLYAAENLIRSGWRRMRAEVPLGGSMFQHAVRVGVGTTVAEAAGRAVGDFWGNGLPQHGFWAALTTMLVLFPDYEHTFARGWARPVGSIAGGVLAWLLFQLHWGNGASAIATVVLAALTFSVLRTGQHTLNLFLTAWLVFLLFRMGDEQGLVAWGRPADTVLGAVIALVVFLLLPTWHHHRIPGLLARWLRVQQQLLPAVLTGHTDTGALDPAQLETLRNESRQAREELESAVAKLAAEPGGHRARWDRAQLGRIQHGVFDLTRCTAVLVDQLPQRQDEVVPELAEFAEPLHRHLDGLARAAAGAGTVQPGALRTEFDTLAARNGLAWVADPHSGEVSRVRARALTSCLRTVTAVEELTAQLDTPTGRHQHRRPGHADRSRHPAPA